MTDGERSIRATASMKSPSSVVCVMMMSGTTADPKKELRNLTQKKVTAKHLDLVMIPGFAFDRNGARMGHYDKLLQHARKDAPLVALAFECQLFPEIPTQARDIYMGKIITEKAAYPGKGRSS